MKEIKRAPNIQNLLDNFAKKTFGKSTSEAHGEGVCVFCGKEAKSFKDYLSAKEYQITGMCQFCQDEMEKQGEEEYWNN